MNSVPNSSGRLAQLQLPLTPFLIEIRQLQASSFRSKWLSGDNALVAMGTMCLICLLSYSVFNSATTPELFSQATLLTNLQTSIAAKSSAPEAVPSALALPLQSPSNSVSSVAKNIPAVEITECAHSPFALQIGAYQMRIEAEKQISRLKRNSETARIIKVEIPNKGIWYRVQVGNFTECVEAIQTGQKLQAEKEFSEFIVTDYQNPIQ